MFTHLHTHSYYSLLDGLASPLELATKAKQLGQQALALTDHGNMFGTIDFYCACNDIGIKPIIGMEAYVAPTLIDNKDPKYRYDHMTLLAMNNNGYKNLMLLSTEGYIHGFYYKPRIDMDLLYNYNDGLIILSGCMYSKLSRLILNNQLDDAILYLKTMKQQFGDRFYIEMQDFNIPQQDKLRKTIPQMGCDLHIPIVATNDTHYLNKEDVKAHEILLCIGSGKSIQDKDRFRFDTDQLYIKTYDEMNEVWPKEYLDISNEIADRCNIKIELGKVRHIYEKESSFTTLEEIVSSAFENKFRRVQGLYSNIQINDYQNRLKKELEAIKKTGYAEYIMIVADFIKYAKDNGIPVGSGRGSSAGSLVCYLLGITNIDPIKYGLLFERFINIDRTEPPDIDVDICQERRNEVIQYLINKYGTDRVAHIISFGSMKTRGVIRDVCRAMGYPWILGDTISKHLGIYYDGTVADAFNRNDTKTIAGQFLNSIQMQEFIDICTKIENKLRHSSTHASGIVISDRNLLDITPLYKRVGQDDICTQYDMTAIGRLGLVKFDILGLRTITLIHEACKMIGINPDDIPLDDAYVYQAIGNGITAGVFQYEGWGYTQFIKRMKPKKFDDLIALGALFRPGTLNSGMADDYINRMHGAPYTYDISGTEDTYGILLYQEQVMEAAVRYAGFTMNEADILRKAIGKKDQKLMDEMINRFKVGMQMSNKNLYKPDELNIVIDEFVNKITTFARYGWNKAHSVSYALLSYYTAWLRFNHPLEFWCATLNSEINDNKRLSALLSEAQNTDNITIEPPHINISDIKFMLYNNRLYAGLLSIKGIGKKACEYIINEREKNGQFIDADDFRKRITAKNVNILLYNTLINNGCFREIQDIYTKITMVPTATEFDIFQLKEWCRHNRGAHRLVIQIGDKLYKTKEYVNEKKLDLYLTNKHT